MVQEHSQADDSEDAAGPLLIQKLEVKVIPISFVSHGFI